MVVVRLLLVLVDVPVLSLMFSCPFVVVEVALAACYGASVVVAVIVGVMLSLMMYE